ncbi:adenine phosphoribosyltransferase [Arctopsyche grandis]|uniref:adenine phosphoribosyltransferase n=1 Tax=Arctopsyche grandis TaxID=121162 RepID=UPI00406D8F10
MSMETKISFIKEHIRDFPDFPKKGIIFRDILSALSNGSVCKVLNEVLIQYIKENFPDVEAIIALESRGFLFSFSVAAEFEIACIPIRKKGKLPGEVISRSYELEYGSDVFEVQKDSLKKPGLKCLIIDDLIATGGSMEAVIKLLESCNCDVIGCLAVIELVDLKGREKLANTPVHSFIQY